MRYSLVSNERFVFYPSYAKQQPKESDPSSGHIHHFVRWSPPTPLVHLVSYPSSSSQPVSLHSAVNAAVHGRVTSVAGKVDA